MQSRLWQSIPGAGPRTGRHARNEPADRSPRGLTARMMANRGRLSAMVRGGPRRAGVWAALASLVYPAYLGWAGPAAARVQLVAQPLPVEHATKVVGPDDDLFATDMTTSHDHDEGLWLSWSLVDTSREERVGSANSAIDLGGPVFSG
jgi:hypothetical protein